MWWWRCMCVGGQIFFCHVGSFFDMSGRSSAAHESDGESTPDSDDEQDDQDDEYAFEEQDGEEAEQDGEGAEQDEGAERIKPKRRRS